MMAIAPNVGTLKTITLVRYSPYCVFSLSMFPMTKAFLDANLEDADLALLAEQPLSISPADLLATQHQAYGNASLEEIADLLEGVVESYALLRPTLPPQLRQSARDEIEFFANLFQDQLNQLLGLSTRRHGIDSTLAV